MATTTGSGSSRAAARPTRFQAFCAELEVALCDERAATEAVSGAVHAFEGVEAIMSAVTSLTRVSSPGLERA